MGDTWHENHVGDTRHGACVIVTLGMISGVMVTLRKRSKENKVEWGERITGCSYWNRLGEREIKRRKRERGRGGGRTAHFSFDLRHSDSRSPPS